MFARPVTGMICVIRCYDVIYYCILYIISFYAQVIEQYFEYE